MIDVLRALCWAILGSTEKNLQQIWVKDIEGPNADPVNKHDKLDNRKSERKNQAGAIQNLNRL